MAIRAAFFDVGDTLVEHWIPTEETLVKTRERVCAAIGERPWLDEWLDIRDLEPRWNVSLANAIVRRADDRGRFEPEEARQETLRWQRAWFEERGIDTEDIDLDDLRSRMCVPLDEISSPVAGAIDALRWCAERDLRVVLVTNTLWRGDVEALEDWRRFGAADAITGVVSSHSAGWRKPHPAIFERALEIAGVDPSETFHVGDNLIADVWGAQQLGIRAIWRRTDTHREMREVRRANGVVDECEHPSGRLLIHREDAVACLACGGPTGVRVRPDAVIDDLTELQAAVSRW